MEAFPGNNRIHPAHPMTDTMHILHVLLLMCIYHTKLDDSSIAISQYTPKSLVSNSCVKRLHSSSHPFIKKIIQL